MEDPLDVHVEPEHPNQPVGHTTEPSEVHAHESGGSGVDGEKQEDDKRDCGSGGAADADDGEQSGLGEEEEENFEFEEEEEVEDEKEQEVQT